MDTINHPKHYNNTPYSIECIDIVKYMPFHIGNCVKYVWRAPYKGTYIEDLQKSKFYFDLFHKDYKLTVKDNLAIFISGFSKKFKTDMSIAYVNYKSMTYAYTERSEQEIASKLLLDALIEFIYRDVSPSYQVSQLACQRVLDAYQDAMKYQ